MRVLIVGHQEVELLLPMADCIDVMAQAFRALHAGHATQPTRTAVWLPDRRGALGLMPAFMGEPAGLGAKVITVVPGNRGTPYSSHQGAVLLFEPQHGRLLAMVDATAITAVRTAAVSVLATRLLARPEADSLAILGCGTQAATHLEALRLVRPVRRVRIWSRSAAHVQRFAEQAATRHALPVEPCASAREAVAGADLICTATDARAPVLCGDWVAPGVHINAIGASVPPFRELDTACVVRSRLFVDRRESAIEEADDVRIPLQEGAISQAHIVGDLGEVLAGAVPGRTAPEQVTLFKSLGLAVEDLAAAQEVYLRALERGRGTQVEFSGQREE